MLNKSKLQANKINFINTNLLHHYHKINLLNCIFLLNLFSFWLRKMFETPSMWEYNYLRILPVRPFFRVAVMSRRWQIEFGMKHSEFWKLLLISDPPSTVRTPWRHWTASTDAFKNNTPKTTAKHTNLFILMQWNIQFLHKCTSTLHCHKI